MRLASDIQDLYDTHTADDTDFWQNTVQIDSVVGEASGGGGNAAPTVVDQPIIQSLTETDDDVPKGISTDVQVIKSEPSMAQQPIQTMMIVTPLGTDFIEIDGIKVNVAAGSTTLPTATVKSTRTFWWLWILLIILAIGVYQFFFGGKKR